MGAQKKPFFTGRTILSQTIRFVNNFFLYFFLFLEYNVVKQKEWKGMECYENYGDRLW